jgi:DNA invertase Pin-like site-specific DNA recombinase
MPVCYGYVRVSTTGQVEEGVSLEAQQAKIAVWAELNGYELAGVFVDAGLSGGRADNRPQLLAALNAVAKVKGAALVVYSLSRLARSTADTLAIAAELEKSNADLVSLSEKIDTTTAAGRMVFRLLASLAEFERDQVSERTKMALAHKKRRGERVGRVPLGFELAADGKTLVPVAAELAVVKLVAELWAKGMSLRAIAAELDRQGVPTKAGQGKWQRSTIQRLVARGAA